MDWNWVNVRLISLRFFFLSCSLSPLYFLSQVYTATTLNALLEMKEKK